jgi:hypothetical protein
MNKKTIWISFLGLALIFSSASCTRDKVGSPSPTGPSTLALVLKLAVDPNVLLAGPERQETAIVATLKRYDGTPVAGRTIYFEINNAANDRVNVGLFDGGNPVSSRVTDAGGNAYVNYFGPLNTEVSSGGVLHIWATVALDGNNTIKDYVTIEIIR